MRAKKIGFFLSLLLLSSAFMFTAGALPDTTTSFRGDGVTIDVTYPEEAQPNTNITHYITITSSTTVTLRNFTVVIKAPVNSSLQEILNGMNVYGFPPELPQNYTLTLPLPQDANGLLQCFIFVNTSTIDDLSTVFYTTLVSEPPFSEMQILYEEMLANYTELQANYTTLLNDYNSLLDNYNSLFDNYTTLLSQYNQLSTEYNAKVTTYQTLLADYNKLSDDYDTLYADYRLKTTDYNNLNSTLNSLQGNYTSLQESHNSLQENYTSLKADYDELNQNYDDLRVSTEGALNIDRILMFIFVITLVALIALIIYLKRGKEEPYVVIRKETVNMKQDENPDQPNQT
jgi:hypothetical protein